MTSVNEGTRKKAKPAKTLILGLLVLIGLSAGSALVAADHEGWHTQDRDDLDAHCPDHQGHENKVDNPSGDSVHMVTVDGVDVWLYFSEDLFTVEFYADENLTTPISVEFCIKAGDKAGGIETGTEGHVSWLNQGGQRPEISYVVVYALAPPDNGPPDNGPPDNDVPPIIIDEPCVGPQWITGFAEAEPPTNVIEWDSFEGATGYNLYRATEGGAFVLYATTDAGTTTFHDTDVVPFTTYQYQVSAQMGEEESDICDMVEVTAIPVFPSLIAGALAAAIGIGAYAASSRRKD
jgi:hypothetical protein